MPGMQKARRHLWHLLILGSFPNWRVSRRTKDEAIRGKMIGRPLIISTASYRIDESHACHSLYLYPRSRSDDHDVVVIDQSRSDDTEQAIKLVDTVRTRLTYARSQTVGSAVAHNLAVERARGPLVAFTDDDCEVSP